MTATLHTIWQPGYSSVLVTGQQFGGAGNGTLSVTATGAFDAQQIFTLTATSATTFEVSGSKLNTLPSPYNIITVGTPYSNGLFNATITAGSTAFQAGDNFIFAIGNFETTRYVYRDANQNLYDFFGGPSADTNSVGAWLVPRMFYTNVSADNGELVPEGTLYSHFRGILSNQLPSATEIDTAFGGSIKLWSEQQNLLAALLMQRDMTPISMIDLAQRQYETAVNMIIDLYMREIVQYQTSNNATVSAGDCSTLLDFLLTFRTHDQDVRTVLFDTTAPVIGFPATLPQLGVSPLVQPGVIFDDELGVELMQAHDGHLTPLYSLTFDFRDRLFSPNTLIKRSDGTFTPAIGSYNSSPPASPYKGELWFENAQTLQVFNVLSDGLNAPVATAVGQYWYKRAGNALFVWDGALWQPESNPLAPWQIFDPAERLNDTLQVLEQRLFDGINAEHRTYFSEDDVDNALTGSLSTQLQRELATWAAANGYDPTAPDYVSTDAFTWNYSSLGMPSRWYKALWAQQLSVSGVIKTSRPNLEPWKLLGNATKPSSWDTTWKAAVQPADVANPANAYITGPDAKVVRYSGSTVSTTLSGLQTIDGVSLSAGDKVLLVSETASANNGLWVVSSSAWARHSTPLIIKLVINVDQGFVNAGTAWVLTAAVPVLNTSPVLFSQVRLWNAAMWVAIQAAHPTLKLGVNTALDTLLPPYVNSALASASNALTNTIPTSAALPYTFGQGSPVETVWSKSVEYRYSLVRALFRKDPLSFLGNCWGFEWVEVDNILYDGFDISVPGHPRFRLQGDPIAATVRGTPFTCPSLSTTASTFNLTLTHDGYTSDRKQSFSVRTTDGTRIGYVHEGVTSTFSAGGYTMTSLRIEDEGKPFRVGDKFLITANADGSNMHSVLTQATYVQFLGFGQTFTNALRASSIDTNQGYAIQAYKGWDVNLGYRAGGLVSTDDLRVYTDTDALPASSYNLRFKRSPYAQDLWVQALRISVVQIGSNVSRNGVFVPSTDASDWIFRIEGYNARYLGISYYTFSSGSEVTFNALSGAHTNRAWTQPTIISGTTSTQLPLSITGLQNVVNFLFGYSDFIQAQGWSFTDENGKNIDVTTGRTRNWQLEIEKLIDAVYGGINLGQGHVLNPFMDRIWLDQPTGLLSEFFDSQLFDITGHPGIFDTFGAKIKTKDLTVLRKRGKSQIGANIPMFSVHAQVDEYEHLFVFNNLSSPSTNSGTIYDPFSGARVSTIKLNGRRQAANTLRPEFGGHYLVGDEVKQNLQAAVDKVSTYYDPDHVFEDQLSTEHALALLGYSPKTYLSNLDLTERTQFNFWRGLIQMKGTNASIDAYLNNNRIQDAQLDEYWAYKVAQYGDARPKVFPELKLTVADTIQQFTKLQFDAVSALPAFVQIAADDETRWFSIDDLDGETSFGAQVVGTYTAPVTINEVLTLPFIADLLTGFVVGTDATVINSRTLKSLVNGTLNIVGYGPATPKFNPIKLFNYVADELVEDIPIWHPAIGQHTPEALEDINIISAVDPARYNVSTQVIGNANYDPLRFWGAKQVGRVWWDTTNLDYVPYYDKTIYTEIDERLSRWGTLADYASVDVVEWVQSSVDPSLYDAQAVLDAGNADLDPNTKADGQVYGSKTYSRTRAWQIRPIAWSHSSVATEAAHIGGVIGSRGAFSADYRNTLVLTHAGLVCLSSGTFAAAGIVSGMRIGAFEDTPSQLRALSENIITGFKKFIGAPDLVTAFTPVSQTTSGLQALVDVQSITENDAVGQLLFVASTVATQRSASDGSPLSEWDVASYITVNIPNSAFTDMILIRNDAGVVNSAPNYGATFTTFVGQIFTFTILGLQITVTAQTAGTYDSNVLGTLIAAALGSNLTLFDACTIEGVVPALAPVYAGDMSNLSNDWTNTANIALNGDVSGEGGVGWRAWSVPTQAQLDADAHLPNSSWYPMIGPFVSSTPTISIIQDAATSTVITLNNGTIVSRYSTSWDNWVQLTTGTLRATSISVGALAFTVSSGTTIDRISVYMNGVAQLSGTYTLLGTTLTVLSVPTGSEAVVIVRPYTPTVSELAFDPDVKDNLLIQQQYKVDYQYVAVPVWDIDGTIQTTVYYFWVKNRSIASPKKTLSVKSMANLLVTGPSGYLTFQNITGGFPYDTSVVTTTTTIADGSDDEYGASCTQVFTEDFSAGLGLYTYLVGSTQWTNPTDTYGPAVAYVGGSAGVATIHRVLSTPVEANRFEFKFKLTSTGANGSPFVAMFDSGFAGPLIQPMANSTVDGAQRILINPGSGAVYIPSVPTQNVWYRVRVSYLPTVNASFAEVVNMSDMTVLGTVSFPGDHSAGVNFSNLEFNAQTSSLMAGCVFDEFVFYECSSMITADTTVVTHHPAPPVVYDSIAISGLNYVVTKDDTFKLRFTRDFTLRDDPNQLDLKDTHVEWKLIRSKQTTTIPEVLYQKMVDSACGQDAGGNILPAPRRAAYDDRNGTRTQFGFGADQILAPSDLIQSTLLYTILNTTLVDNSGAVPMPDYMLFLNFSLSDTWFSTPENTRNTLTIIWNQAKVTQINELFFAVLEEILAANYELTDLFKTSRLSAYSIRVVETAAAVQTYE